MGLVLIFVFLVLIPAVFILLAIRIPRRKVLFWTIACLLYPVYLLIPLLDLFSAGYKQGTVLEGVYGVAMLTSGPGGLLVSALCDGFDGNFPADNNWLYFIILLAVVCIQMAGLWLLGRWMLREKYKPLGGRGALLVFIFFGMFILGLVHCFIMALCHS